MRSELVVRFDYGHVVPWVRHDADGLHAIAGPDALDLRTPVELRGENLTTQSRFTLGPATSCRSSSPGTRPTTRPRHRWTRPPP
jgi:hypothetical protein